MLLALGDELCTDHVAAFVPHEALLLLPICPVPPGNMLKVCPCVLVQRLSKLMRLLLCNFKQAGSVNRPDVAAAGAAIGLLVAQQSAARVGLLQLGGLKPLLAMLHQGTLAEQSVSANVLFDMSQGEGT